jgi:dipeptidyl aminopeptidase/acylaminoacyl peptidase
VLAFTAPLALLLLLIAGAPDACANGPAAEVGEAVVRNAVVAEAIVAEAVVGGTDADYAKAKRLPGALRGLVARERVNARWFEGEATDATGARPLVALWYEVELGRIAISEADNGGRSGSEPGRWRDGRAWVRVELATGAKRPLFDHAAVAEALRLRGFRGVDERALPIRRVQLVAGGLLLLVREAERVVTLHCSKGAAPAIRDATPEESASFEVALDRQLRRSRRQGGREVFLTFANERSDAVTLAWIDASGQRRDYGEVAAASSREQHTFAGHAWALFAADGTLIGSLVAPDWPARVRIPARGSPEATEPDAPAPPSSAIAASVGRHATAAALPAGSAAVTSASASIADGPSIRVNGWNVEVLGEDGSLLVATTDGTESLRYGEPFRWSPDRTKVAVTRRAPAQQRTVHIVESTPPDQLQPKLRSFDYLKPGDRIEQTWPVILDVKERRVIPTPDAERLTPNPWSIDWFAWSADGGELSFVYNERGHRVMRVIAMSATDGTARTIINEECATFFDYAWKFLFHRLESRGAILWMSERDGWNHLYLIDARTGEVRRQLTKGPWVVRSIERIDEGSGEVWFMAGGVHPEQDPYHLHLCRVSIDSGALTILTTGDGTHEIEFSPDRSHFIARWSRVDQPTVTELRRASDGSLVAELERGDWSALIASGWRPPERFVAKGRPLSRGDAGAKGNDPGAGSEIGQEDIWGVIWRPTARDAPLAAGPAGSGASGLPPYPDRLPVIELIYAGPQGAFVPKSFSAWHGARDIAELGFIVVQIDGMGTSHRSKAFHDVCWRNLKDAGFPDRIAWIRAAAATRPEFDIARVGIYGGSAGGQNAMRALLDHGDFYSVAVADCGCHDNRMDKIWWNELWMSWPVDDAYLASSNAVDAAKLRGKLLLTVGELDQNVDPASTMQVVDALIKADKDFDLIVLPGMGHGAGESDYGRRRRADYFVRHLLGVEPRRPLRAASPDPPG